MKDKYDYLIVGAGLFGSVCAYELNNKGYKCLVLDKRNHIGGNCFTSNRDGIHVHEYGPHIFHTSNEQVWTWINQFVKFNNFIYSPIANYKNDLYSLPFNMWTFTKLWEITTPQEAKDIIERQGSYINNPQNLEEQAIKLVGKDVYEKLIKGYTEKQWRKSCVELPKEIINRLPVRFTYNNNYFNDKYQGIPVGGYTQIFNKLLADVDVVTDIDYLEDKQFWNEKIHKVIYTGPIDRYYNYRFGELEYKTTKFVHRKVLTTDYQGCAVMNYTDSETTHTRIIEHKHFEFGTQSHTWITFEHPIEYKANQTEPMYPVNDIQNNIKYNQYKELANAEKNVTFGGRLAEYKYYDMHQVIENALKIVSIL